MNMRQLEAFRATVRCGSITDAARMVHISQPSISRLIADLERSIGFALFARIGRGLAPAVEGQTFYRAVEGMFAGIGELKEIATSIRTSKGGTISIGTIQSIATTKLPATVGLLLKRRPDTKCIIHCRNTPAILDAVQMNQLNLGIVGRNPNYEGVDILGQVSAPYVCLIPEDHQLAYQSGPVDLEEISDSETFITSGGAYPDAMMSVDSRLSQKLQDRSRVSATNMPVAAALVRTSGALTIADPFSADQAVQVGGVVFRPIVQKLTYFVTLIAAGREHLPQSALEFPEILAGQLEDRVKQVQAFWQRSQS